MWSKKKIATGCGTARAELENPGRESEKERERRR